MMVHVGLSDGMYALAKELTTVFRKGEEVTSKRVGNVQVTEVYGYPHASEAPDGDALIDLHFIKIAVDKDAAVAKQSQFEALLALYPEPERLAGGPSYIELGGVLGDQELALRMIAIGAALGLWSVITPATLGVEGPMADQLAGSGMVMMTGYSRKVEA